jgi:hypothetical protein
VATAPNLGTGGTALDAQFGSSSTSNTNEPLALAHSGTNYLYLPGVSGNYASAPDSAALSITGDIDLRALVAFDDWTPTSTHPIMAKRSGGTAATWSYELLNVSGSLRIQWFDTGTGGFRNLTSSVVNSITDGTSKWVRATLDVDNGAAGCTATFYTSDDAATWTTLGTAQTAATIAAISDSTAALEIGSNQGGAGGQPGKFYRAQVLNGIGGTIAFDANFTSGITSGAQATFAESSSNAATVTINRASSGRKSVAVVRPVWLLGTDDFFEVADNDLIDFGSTDSFTAWAVVRQWGTPTSFGRYIAKRDSSGAGWVLTTNGTAQTTFVQLSDGTNSPSTTSTTTRTAGALSLVSMRVDRSTQTVGPGINGTLDATVSTSAVGSIANALTMRIGRAAGSATGYQDFELIAAGVHRRALSATELAQIATYYGVS